MKVEKKIHELRPSAGTALFILVNKRVSLYLKYLLKITARLF